MIINIKKVLHGEKVTSVSYDESGVEKTIECWNVGMDGKPNTALESLKDGATVDVETFTSKKNGKTYIGGLAGQKKAWTGKGGGGYQKTDTDFLIMILSYAKDLRVAGVLTTDVAVDAWVEARYAAIKSLAKKLSGDK